MTPGIPKGTRDFGPEELYKRRYIFDIIQKHFELYGYSPIETPSMENLETLLGKYGDEGDQLLFKVLNNGDFLSKVPTELLDEKNSQKATSHLSKRGLRYDLTVPFARYVVMHRNDISLPFKRYQIQPVWRADRPQKGRYQEFYQCDVDVAGGRALTYEAELVQVYDEVFAALGIPVEIRINHRQLLYGLAAYAGVADRWVDMTMAIDKLDKIGEAGVRKEMQDRGIATDAQDRIFSALQVQDLSGLTDLLEQVAEARTGLED